MSAPWIDLPPKYKVKDMLLGKANSISTGTKYSAVVHAVERYQAIPKDEHSQFLARVMHSGRQRRRGEIDNGSEIAATSRLSEKACGERRRQSDVSRRNYPVPATESGSNQRPSRIPQTDVAEADADGSTSSPAAAGLAEGVGRRRNVCHGRQRRLRTNGPVPPRIRSLHGQRGRSLGQCPRRQLGPVHDRMGRARDQSRLQQTLSRLDRNDRRLPLEHYPATCSRPVQYATDGKLLESTKLVSLDGGSRLFQSEPMARSNFSTPPALSEYHAKAYVLTTQGDLIVGIHEPGKLHHSSLVGGGVGALRG